MFGCCCLYFLFVFFLRRFHVEHFKKPSANKCPCLPFSLPYNNESTNICHEHKTTTTTTPLCYLSSSKWHTNEQTSTNFIIISIYCDISHSVITFIFFLQLRKNFTYLPVWPVQLDTQFCITHRFFFYPVLKPLTHFTDDHHNKVFFFFFLISNKTKEKKERKKTVPDYKHEIKTRSFDFES